MQAVGVQELIDKLKTDGVTRGQQQAEEIISAAREEAVSITDDARREADQILANAKLQAQQMLDNGKQALQLASRDAILKLRESFQQEIHRKFTALVGQHLSDKSLLQKLILEVAGRARPEDSKDKMEVLVPSTLNQFVQGLAADMLREGVSFGTVDGLDGGVRVRLSDKDVDIDLTEETVTRLLMQFLAPRFRAFLESHA
jgi:V/A-type H+-transporting ATPase subunit E